MPRMLNIFALLLCLYLLVPSISECQRAPKAKPENPNLDWARKEAQKIIDLSVTEYKGRYYIKTTDAKKFSEHKHQFKDHYTRESLSGIQILETDKAYLVFLETPLTDIDRDNGYDWIAAASFYLYGRMRHYNSATGWGCWFKDDKDIASIQEYPAAYVTASAGFLNFHFKRFRSGKTQVDPSDGYVGNPSWKVLTKPTLEEIKLIVDEPRRREGCP